MNLIRWEPFAGMDQMFNPLLPNLFGRFPRYLGSGDANHDWAPPVDISETGEEYLIRAALPAVKKEDVNVTVEDGMLTLAGERQQTEDLKDEKFHKVESFYGNFSRSFALPEYVNEKGITADAKDGVLTVHIPKTKVEAAKPTTIKVQ
jgi:HSP20 family protein